jgi:hypothetical protein
MHLGRHNRKFDRSMEGTLLEEVHEKKEFGVLLITDMKVVKQCSQAYLKANRILVLFNRTIEDNNVDVMLCM